MTLTFAGIGGGLLATNLSDAHAPTERIAASGGVLAVGVIGFIATIVYLVKTQPTEQEGAGHQ